MAMRMKRVLYSVVASCALAGALYVPARATGLNIETATITDLNAAFADGTLTSEQLVSAYLKRIEAYDKQGPAINAIITLNKKALDEARYTIIGVMPRRFHLLGGPAQPAEIEG